jgi:probable DNA metabolism protein
MRSVDPGDDFESWRAAARDMLDEGVPPQEILWEAERGLFASAMVREQPPVKLRVPAAFVELAKTAACHNDPQRWGLLYQILWRVVRGGERHLLAIASDPDMARARLLEKNVRREIHKMHAFVRFKLIDADAAGRERYAAWFEPDHFIVAAASPFFRNRFANMDWSIFTPKGCAHWNGKQLSLTAGIAENPVENPDALEDAWRTYYRSIFNPARVKVKAMQAEMPKRYWKNLPEADLIDELIAGSKQRLTGMLEEPLRPVKPQPKNAYLDKLRDRSAGEGGA